MKTIDRTSEARKYLSSIDDFRHYVKYFMGIEDGIAGDFAYSLQQHLLKQERQLLEAKVHIERLRQAMLRTVIHAPIINNNTTEHLTDVLAASPKQSLFLHDADILEEFINERHAIYSDGTESVERTVGLTYVHALRDKARREKEA